MRGWVLFDFDGTLSLLRAGWQEVMQQVMFETLAEGGAMAGDLRLESVWAERISRYIADSTGIQTVEQMQWLRQQVKSVGREPESVWTYKARYRDRLHAWIQERIASVAEGRTTPDQYLVAGSRALLQALQAEGLILVLASGTDDDDVQAEARLLGVADYFDEIRGAIDHSRDNPKVAVIEAMMAQWGQHLAFRAVIGDGPVEIEIGRRYQALTIGVASDERVAGCRDPEKEARLHQAGAQWIVDDLSDVEAIMGHIRRAAVP